MHLRGAWLYKVKAKRGMEILLLSVFLLFCVLAVEPLSTSPCQTGADIDVLTKAFLDRYRPAEYTLMSSATSILFSDIRSRQQYKSALFTVDQR